MFFFGGGGGGGGGGWLRSLVMRNMKDFRVPVCWASGEFRESNIPQLIEEYTSSPERQGRTSRSFHKLRATS